MIECWIQGTTGGDPTIYPCLVPAISSSLRIPPAPPGEDPAKWAEAYAAGIEQLQAMGAAIGLSVSDLLSIDIPGGASRYSCARLIFPSTALTDMYRAGDGADSNWTLKWRESASAAVTNTMRVWLRPPRPLFWPQGNGPVIVECVDRRFWHQFIPTATIRSGSLTYDGRYLGYAAPGASGSGDDALGKVRDICESLIDALYLTITLPVGFDPPKEALLSVINLVSNYTGNAALLLDMILAECGWVFQHLASDDTYQIVQMGDDVTVLGTWMNSTMRAKCGGIATTADDTNSPDVLIDQWNGYAASTPPGADWVKNLGPNTVAVVIQEGYREGNARFDNQTAGNDFGTDDASAPPVGNPRPLTDIGKAVTRTSAVLPSHTDNLTGSYPWTTTSIWDIRDYRIDRYVERCKVACGATVFGGWLAPPRGAYRQTSCKFTLVDFKGLTGYAPATIVKADWNDWTLGSDGRMQMDPSQLIVPRGNLVVTDLLGGGKFLSVAPPQVRVFMAMILAEPVLCDGEWRALYKWQEVEPNQDPECGEADRWVYDSAMCRAWDDDEEEPNYAENTAENNNVYNSFIWPGTTLADYPDATITWQAIEAGGPVPMIELIPTVWPFSNYPNAPRAQYMFCIPNDPIVACNP